MAISLTTDLQAVNLYGYFQDNSQNRDGFILECISRNVQDLHYQFQIGYKELLFVLTFLEPVFSIQILMETHQS